MVWGKMLEALVTLAKRGFMLNLKKCKFLVKRLEIVGHEVENGLYTVKDKVVCRLFEVPPPKTFKQLQKLMGQLNYIRRLVPNYSMFTAPLASLLSRKSKALWTPECGQAVRKVCEVLSRKLALQIADCNKPFHIYLDTGPEGSSAVVC